ncbi:MAG: GNAT family N-acetyltransferase [Ruminococcaceae bacterium]|nr:GNAT family N-acetyltransferase [Oscillospiraceae bacterium]
MQNILFTNKLEVKVFHQLPQDAIDIRNEVFVDEQGFQEEFDTDDGISTHLVGFFDGKSVATARIIPQGDKCFIIGRVAVRKNYRNLGFGAKIISEAERVITSLNGKAIYIHSQLQAVPFYEKQGYVPTGEKDFEEDCEHWMLKKDL